MNTLERHVLEIIGEDPDNPDVFVDTDVGMAPVRDSINDAIEEISMVTGADKKEYHLPLKANRLFYRLKWQSDSLGWITDAWLYGTKRRLDRKDFGWLRDYNPRWLHNSGTPERYVPIGYDLVCLHPVPSSDADSVVFSCAVIPGRYATDSERVRVRDNYRWAVVHYAVSEYHASRGDAQQAMRHHADYVRLAGFSQLYPKTAERWWQQKTVKNELADAAK